MFSLLWIKRNNVASVLANTVCLAVFSADFLLIYKNFYFLQFSAYFVIITTTAESFLDENALIAGVRLICKSVLKDKN